LELEERYVTRDRKLRLVVTSTSNFFTYFIAEIIKTGVALEPTLHKVRTRTFHHLISIGMLIPETPLRKLLNSTLWTPMTRGYDRSQVPFPGF